MKASFLDFKLSLGVTSQDRDTEYAYILKSLIKELYTVYGIAICKDVLSNTETINSTYGTTVQLAYKNIVEATITGFTEDVDYTIDLTNGELVLLQGGSMTENTDYTVTYTYYLFINESNEIIYDIYPDEYNDTNIYFVDVKPCTLKQVTLDGTVLTEDVDYYFYNNKFEVVGTITDYRKPYKLQLEVGFEEIPLDLKQAFYDLANIRFDIKDTKAYILGKTTDNSQGISTTYKIKELPSYIKDVLMAYTGRRFIL